VDASREPRVGLSSALTAQELDLEVVQGVHVRKPVLDRAAQERVVGEELVALAPSIVLVSASQPERLLRVATDGLRPFTVQPGTPP